MNNSYVGFSRLRGRCIACLMILLVFTPFLIHAQEDFDRLFEIGKRAFDQNDYITAHEKLTAYWYIMRYEYQHRGLSVDDAFYSEVINAAQYARARITEMIDRMETLEQTEKKLRQDLAVCTGISTKGSFLKSPPPKPPLRSKPPGR